MVSMIIPELHFFDIQREFIFGDAMEFDEPFLGIAPESFESVDIDLASGKSLTMIHPEMPISAKHETVIAFELVRIDNSPSPDSLHRHTKERSRTNIHDYFYFHQAVPLEYTKDGYLVLSSPSPFPLTPASKVGFIGFDFSAEDIHSVISMSDNALSDDIECLKHGRIGNPCLQGSFTSRYLQLKELDKPEPIPSRDVKAADPASGEDGEFISATCTTEAIPSDSINFSFVTSVTKNAAIFLTRFLKITPGTFLRFYDCFKRLYVHTTTLSWWQNFYNYLEIS